MTEDVNKTTVITPEQRLLHIVHSEIADCNDASWRETPDFSNRGPKVEQALASVGLGAGNPWCAAYQYQKFEQAGYLNVYTPEGDAVPLLPKSGLVQEFVNHFKQHGRLITAEQGQKGDIRQGDFVFIYYPRLKRYAHMELIVNVASHGDFESVGGNTTTVAWAREGDRVVAHERNVFDRNGGLWRYAYGRTS